MEVLNDFKNNLLKRRELKLVVEAGKNPGIKEAEMVLAEEFNANKDSVVIKALKSNFGMNAFLIDAFIYDSAEDKSRVEMKKKENKLEEKK